LKTSEKARGNWVEIIVALTGADAHRYLSGKKGPCPFPGCGGKDRFRFDNKDGNGTFFCNTCGSGNGFEYLKNAIGCEFTEAAHRVETFLGGNSRRVKVTPLPKKEKFARDLKAADFNESLMKTCDIVRGGDAVQQYLSSRGFSSSYGAALFYTSKLYDVDSKRTFPGMVARIHSPAGEVVALHRTFLCNGQKADIDSPKKITKPATTIKGGAIRLWPLSGETLAITEGIETALAVKSEWAPGCPVWAVMSADGMQSFVLPDQIKKLSIFADNDRNFVGQSAAYGLAARLVREGTLEKGNIVVYCPKFGGDDFLDEFNRNKKL